MYWDRKSRPEFGMCSVRFIQLFLTKNIKEKTGDLTFRLEWAGFRFTQCPVSSGFTVFKKVKIFQYYLWTGSHHIVKSGKYRFSFCLSGKYIYNTCALSKHIGNMCMRLRNGGKGKASPSLFLHFAPNTHIYLYASTVHMYCIYPAILNRLLDDDKSIWNNFVYVFENNIPRCGRSLHLYVLFISKISISKKILGRLYWSVNTVIAG
jgi:hypothetical protein